MERVGYEKIYRIAHLELELDGPPTAPPVEEGIVISELPPGDDEQEIYAADEESASDERGHVP
ncbi:hypothetical protein [Ktedonospora formicarum]|uniref:Uncharacterized protein n=1 Tax=Ktedonospora formicarum TaxID=2778364 RepID=A0A8J3IC65_9CHLR|nr:hypothetical protein [Ktedonospora formicarum]GHO51316.1 hypothetical protein KSX_94790 [Ktedonospora formicarum]